MTSSPLKRDFCHIREGKILISFNGGPPRGKFLYLYIEEVQGYRGRGVVTFRTPENGGKKAKLGAL